MHEVSPDEPGLLQAIVACEPHAIDQLYEKYSSMLYGFLLSTVENRMVAEEILLEVFAELPDTLPHYKPEFLRLYSFLLQKAREKVRKWQLNKHAQEQVIPVLFGKYPRYVNLTEAEEELFNLCYYNGFTVEDIASVKGLSFEEAQAQCRQVLAKVHGYLANNKTNNN